MTAYTNTSQLQATSAVNSLLSSLLPTADKIKLKKSNKNGMKKKSTAKAQLIDHNLKKRLELQQLDVRKIKKREKKLQKSKIKFEKLQNEKFEKLAKLEILKKHQLEKTLTDKEKKYLKNLVNLKLKSLKSFEIVDEDDKNELIELQNFILDKTINNNEYKRSKNRRNKIKNFKENIKSKSTSNTNDVSDHRYAGLTPGLAPVGLSDEEDSSDEEGEEMEDDY
ncbi:Rrt14p NDAI_0F02350 [Naumovozyma dairenensis CBS 421]|uniref:Regulator of rDNA transcription 14 n=1 Tax=Naumovozyma dairenensis (strain ATCC 10597 / BCRC 20456 / CBS 421 / NBRC 0211 / NRRL Y-12639) TaxID=1071378 RepID=G0WCP2_NAUDC|nr:hypothetical protein NDAI_0F02350 [Naumovozyma dairenensis CBS 421]CCD25553.1 hypothetical protein NDAI_0F02350 [Naumovozyma dairenensis CBS 421]